MVRESGSDTYYYTYTDHLGSILTLTNSSGSIVAEQSFDAWGRRRDANTWVALSPTTAAPPLGAGGLLLYRGYTGHEHLDWFGLINMNGRLYDPALGRMLSVDNYVVGSSETQAFNRYTYAFNNPLVYNDPDGNCPNCITGLIGAGIGGLVNLGVKLYQGKIHSFGDGLAAFGIGAAAGFVTGFTGGAAAGAFGLSTTSILGGAVAGGVGSAIGSPIQGIGNAAYFGDTYSDRQYASDILMGGIFGGVSGGIANLIKAGKTGIPTNIFTDRPLRGGQSIWSLQGGARGHIEIESLTYGGADVGDGTFQDFAGVKVGDKVYRTGGYSSNELGAYGEELLNIRIGGVRQSFTLPDGTRRVVDNFKNGIAHEAKVGRVDATSRIRGEVLKDAELLKTGQIKTSVWHFYANPETLKIGPSSGLLKLLHKHGIRYVIH